MKYIYIYIGSILPILNVHLEAFRDMCSHMCKHNEHVSECVFSVTKK